MSQSTLDDDDLFGEAASEIESDVESSLAAARAALPETETVWAIDGDNTLATLNALKSALDTGAAKEQLRDAKKWFTIGERADAFENPEAIADDIEQVEAALTQIETAHDQVADVAAALPELRSTLDAVHDGSHTEDQDD